MRPQRYGLLSRASGRSLRRCLGRRWDASARDDHTLLPLRCTTRVGFAIRQCNRILHLVKPGLRGDAASDRRRARLGLDNRDVRVVGVHCERKGVESE